MSDDCCTTHAETPAERAEQMRREATEARRQGHHALAAILDAQASQTGTLDSPVA